MAQEAVTKKNSCPPQRTVAWPPAHGYPWDLVSDPTLATPYECFLCKFLARNPVETTCCEHTNQRNDEGVSEDEDTFKMILYCHACITSYVKENKDLCPSGNHPNPKWRKMTQVDHLISKLTWICPRELQQRQKKTGELVVCFLPSPRSPCTND